MEESFQEAVRFFLKEEKHLRATYPQNTIVAYRDSVVFSSSEYSMAYAWAILDSYNNQRSFFDYFIADLKTNSYLGAYHILWGYSSCDR